MPPRPSRDPPEVGLRELRQARQPSRPGPGLAGGRAGAEEAARHSAHAQRVGKGPRLPSPCREAARRVGMAGARARQWSGHASLAPPPPPRPMQDGTQEHAMGRAFPGRRAGRVLTLAKKPGTEWPLECMEQHAACVDSEGTPWLGCQWPTHAFPCGLLERSAWPPDRQGCMVPGVRERKGISYANPEQAASAQPKINAKLYTFEMF